MTIRQQQILRYGNMVALPLVATAVFFCASGGLAALFGYRFGLDPFLIDGLALSAIDGVKNSHPFESAYNCFVSMGTFGTILLTPIFLMLLTAAQKGKSFPLLLRMALASVAALIWGWSVFYWGALLFARL